MWQLQLPAHSDDAEDTAQTALSGEAGTGTGLACAWVLRVPRAARPMRPRALPILALLLLGAPSASAAPPRIQVGAVAPDFVRPRLDGTPLRLADHRGHPLILHFWASWCGPCLAELPRLDSLDQRLRARGAGVLAVNLDKQRGPAEGVVRRLGLRLPVVLDPDGESIAPYDPKGLPTSYLIDAEGVIRLIFEGAMDEATLRTFEEQVQLLEPRPGDGE